MSLDGYVTGALRFRDEQSRIASQLGDDATAARIRNKNKGNVVIPASVEKEIVGTAKTEAQEWVAEIEGRCRQVLLNAHGAGAYDADLIRQQLGAAVRFYLEDVEESEQFARRGRRMKVRNKEAHRAWQKTRLPYLKSIRGGKIWDEVLERAYKDSKDKSLKPAERTAARKLATRMKASKPGKAAIGRRLKAREKEVRVNKRWKQNEIKATVRESLDNDEVTMLVWTTKRDSRVCSLCEPRDGWTVRKDDRVTWNYSPGVHPYCRCEWIPVLKVAAKEWAIKPTPKSKWPDIDGADAAAPGYGGFAEDSLTGKEIRALGSVGSS